MGFSRVVKVGSFIPQILLCKLKASIQVDEGQVKMQECQPFQGGFTLDFVFVLDQTITQRYVFSH